MKDYSELRKIVEAELRAQRYSEKLHIHGYRESVTPTAILELLDEIERLNDVNTDLRHLLLMRGKSSVEAIGVAMLKEREK